MRSGFSAFVFILFLAGSVHAQSRVVRGRFLTDSAKIGERIPFFLSIHYPASESVVFPDSTFAFTPFELEGKKYFQTQTKNNVSVDSAVYFLSTFETDSIQSLRLPVFILNRGDSTAIYCSADTIFVRQLVKVIPESVEAKDLPLKTNADYIKVKWILNYVVVIIVVAILLVILVIGWILFGKKIIRYYRLKKLEKNHRAFLERFVHHVEALRKDGSLAEAESAVVDWKKYMEGLLERPFTKLTTKEIFRMVPDTTLEQALHQVDRMVYARERYFPEEAFDQLKNYSQNEFTRIAQEVKNG